MQERFSIIVVLRKMRSKEIREPFELFTNTTIALSDNRRKTTSVKWEINLIPERAPFPSNLFEK